MSKSQRRVQLATALTALLLSLPAAAATYRVYPVPVEAPTFTAPAPPADARVLLIDPAGTASPFGWHDVDGVAGVEFTVMRGNNVHAYEDLDANGQQTETPEEWNPEDVLEPADARVTVEIEGRAVRVRAWRYPVQGITGHVVSVYLLDTDLPENSERDRDIAHRLYGGDRTTRLEQEIVLGVGGMRALSALDLHFSTPREIAIVGPVDAPVARAALEPFQPNTVAAVGPSDDVPLLAGKGLVDGKPAVYVCERFACQAPVTEAAALSP